LRILRRRDTQVRQTCPDRSQRILEFVIEPTQEASPFLGDLSLGLIKALPVASTPLASRARKALAKIDTTIPASSANVMSANPV
jgi:hypothetical protein